MTSAQPIPEALPLSHLICEPRKCISISPAPSRSRKTLAVFICYEIALFCSVLCGTQAPLKKRIPVRWKLRVLGTICHLSPRDPTDFPVKSKAVPCPKPSLRGSRLHTAQNVNWYHISLCSAEGRGITRKGCWCQAESLPSVAWVVERPPPSCALQENIPLCAPFSCG